MTVSDPPLFGAELEVPVLLPVPALPVLLPADPQAARVTVAVIPATISGIRLTGLLVVRLRFVTTFKSMLPSQN